MPTSTIRLTPGVNFNQTPSLNEASYQTTQLIRWDPGSGLPEKAGGWSKYYPTPISSAVTALHAWEDLSGNLHLGVGAINSLSVITNGTLSDITPQIATSNNAPNFSTTASSQTVTIVDAIGSPTVYDVAVFVTQVSVGGVVLYGAYSITASILSNEYTILTSSPATSTVVSGGAVPTFTSTTGLLGITVVLANHGYTVGSTFPIRVSTAVGGVTLLGFYTVQSVIDANTFSINASSGATSSATVAMNGGNAQIEYYIAVGPPSIASGYGAWGYGIGGYGSGMPLPSLLGTPITATDYTLDNFGGFLVACPANGPIFLWQPQGGLTTAQMIANAPIANTGMLVASAAQIIFAYGSSVLGIQDPLLNNWCNAGDYTSWTATTTNLAGSFRLSKGSHIVGAIQGPQYIVEWTDLDVWAIAFIGAPDVYSFTPLAEGCGLLAKFAAGVLGTTVYWMSQKQFFCLPSGGSVTPLPCTVWDFVFQNLDASHISSIRCAPNSQFGEISWYFPVSGGSGANTAYVKYTPQFNAWDYGYLGRSAWIDQSGLGSPIGSDAATNYIYQHETSNDADGAVLAASFTTGWWALNDGEDYSFCDIVYPDMRWGMQGAAQSAVVNISFTYAAYAQSTTYATPTYTMQSGTPSFLNVRFRGRLASVSLGSNDLGSFWRLGGLRIRTAPDGRLG